MTSQTFFPEIGYSENFYKTKLRTMLEEASHNTEAGAVIFNGDFHWDFSKLGFSPILNVYALEQIILLLKQMCDGLPVTLKKIFISGNHDWWLLNNIIVCDQSMDTIYLKPRELEKYIRISTTKEEQATSVFADIAKKFSFSVTSPPERIILKDLSRKNVIMGNDVTVALGIEKNIHIIGTSTLCRAAEGVSHIKPGRTRNTVLVIAHDPGPQPKRITEMLKDEIEKKVPNSILKYVIYGHIHKDKLISHPRGLLLCGMPERNNMDWLVVDV